MLTHNGTGPAELVPLIRDKALPYLIGRGLDLGCGHEKVKPEAIGIDNQSQYPGAADIAIEVRDVPKFFLPNRWDYIFASHILEHIPHWEQALKEWHGLLKVGGVLFLYLPNTEANNAWSCNSTEACRTHHVVDLSPGLVRQRMEDYRFEIVDWEPDWDQYGCFHIVGRKRD